MSIKTSNTNARTVVIVRSVSILAACAAVTGFAVITHVTGHDDMGRGAIVGGASTLLAIVLLWIFGVRAGTAGRIVSGEADERDRLNATNALADAAKGMAIAALGGTIAALYGLAGPLVGGLILWAGLLTGAISLVIRTRRA